MDIINIPIFILIMCLHALASALSTNENKKKTFGLKLGYFLSQGRCHAAPHMFSRAWCG